MTISAGPAFRASRRQERNGDEDVFGLLSLPVICPVGSERRPAQPDPGRPARGRERAVRRRLRQRSSLSTRPGRTYTHYLKVLDNPGSCSPDAAAVGTLFGAAREEVPADLRFYAGGGGSVRGFSFQLAGELDDDHNPLGGRSLLELSGEVRLRVTETIGVVAFVDAGSAFSTDRAGSERGCCASAPGRGSAISARSAGAARCRASRSIRRSSDDAYQLYVSLGQAF